MIIKYLDGEYKPESPKDRFIVELRESLARQMSKNIWGGGFQFSSASEEIEKKFKKMSFLNKLENFFAFIERQCSLYGRAIVTINKTQTDEYMLSLTQPIWFNGVGKVFIQPQLAVIYQRIQIDTKMMILRSTYTSKYVKNEIFYSDEGFRTIRVFDKSAEVLKSLQIEPYWKHDLGFPPIVEFTNIPFYQSQWLTDEYYPLADWYPATTIEPLIWTTIKNLKKELAFNHSRIVLDGVNQSMLNQIRGNGTFDELSGEESKDYVITAETIGNSKIQFQPGNGDFTKYTATAEHLMDFYFKLAGSSRFSEGGGAQKTVAETSTIRSAMIETINQKLLLRQTQCVELISKWLSCYKLCDFKEADNDFEFKINGNILEDETSHVDNQLKLIQNGIISPIDFIQDLFKLSRIDAKNKFEEVKKFNEENDIMNALTSQLEQVEGGDEEGNFNKTTGEHKDLAKQGKA